jgi:glycosyl hydrolase family 18 (putative chitinase)/purple acid phosphatase-like protein
MKKFSVLIGLVVACSQHHAPAPASSGAPAAPSGSNLPPAVVTAEDVVWTQLVNATANGNLLTKSGGQPWADDAGGESAQSIAAGDGWLEFAAVDNQLFRFVGIGRAHAGTSGGAIDFAYRLQAGRADVYEQGVWKADNLAASGDQLRVAVEGGAVKFYKNGALVFTSATAPHYPLVAAGALVDAGATVSAARLGVDMPMTPPAMFVSGVTAQPSTDGSGATISWTSNVAADGQVEYGTTTGYGSWSVYAPQSSTSHSIAVGGLSPATTYHFRVRSEDAGKNAVLSADASFTTATITTANRHRFCGWLQANGYVPVDQDPGYLAFAAHAADFDAVHPMWYSLTSATTFKAGYGEGSSLVLANTTAGGKRTLLVPTIAAADGSQPSWASQMLHDATLRAQHESAIVQLVTSKHYDGIDLDYEHLPDADRDAFSQFAAELGQQLHVQGKTLSFAVGALTTPRYGHWDYEKLAVAADQLHVMGYDYHYLGSHPGPVAPLGWIKQVLAYIGTIGGGARAGKFILGLPNYGLAGSDGATTTWFGSSMDSIALAGAGYAIATDHMASCPLTNGLTVAPGRAPNVAATAKGHLYFDDLASHEEKVAAAAAAGLGGVTYWTIGGEPDRPGPRTFFQMVRAYYPE